MNQFFYVMGAFSPFIEIAMGGLAACAVYEFFFMGDAQ